MSMIELREVTFTYAGSGHPALRDCSLRVEEGETVLLAGMSGCGKSTVLNLVNGLLLHGGENRVGGEVTVDGAPVRAREPWEMASHVGSVFQNPKSQLFNLDVADEIVFGLENLGASHDAMEEALARASAACGVEELLGRSIFDLSGGEKQRVACASAYALDPSVIVLDEPSANLDEAGILGLRKILRTWRLAGKTVLVAEHRLWYALDVANRVLYLRGGRVEGEYAPDALLALTDEEREELGLRQASRPAPLVVSADEPATGDGLCARDLAASHRGCTVWSGVTFKAPRGSLCAITGPNGTGKSTLARALCGLVRRDAGTVSLDAVALTRRRQRASCSLVMQDVNAQLFGESVLDEVTLGDASLEARALFVLGELDLGDHLDRHPMSLSGGQRQRLAVADCLASDKDVLVLDEPTSGLDMFHMREMGHLLRRLADAGTCVIVIAHDVEFVRETQAVVLPWACDAR
jgi:energy-coupling factor transport system ATP-binding protein